MQLYATNSSAMSIQNLRLLALRLDSIGDEIVGIGEEGVLD